MQKELIESGHREPSDACLGCAVPCGMCDPEITYIAQSPEDYNAAQARIKELERENAHLKILLAGWVDTFGGQLKGDRLNMNDAKQALGRK